MTPVREVLATALLSLMFLTSIGVSNAQTKPSNTDSKPDAAWASVAISEPGCEAEPSTSL